MYAIVIAPEFDKFQVGGAKNDTELELHVIRCYDDQVVTVEQVGGEHVSAPSKDFKLKAENETIDKYKEYGRRVFDEYPQHKPEDESMARFRRDELNEKTRPLFDHIDNVLKNMLHLVAEPKKHYVKYSLDKSVVCSVSRGKARLNLHYNVKVRENVLEASERIRDVSKVGIDGVGEYETKIEAKQDFDDIIPSVERVIRHYRSQQ